MKYKLTKSASRDIEEIFEFIIKDSMSSAEDFLTKTEKTFNDLTLFPKLGMKFSDNFRVISIQKFKKFLIFYQIEDAIIIVRVLNSNRNIQKILNGEKW